MIQNDRMLQLISESTGSTFWKHPRVIPSLLHFKQRISACKSKAVRSVGLRLLLCTDWQTFLIHHD